MPCALSTVQLALLPNLIVRKRQSDDLVTGSYRLMMALVATYLTRASSVLAAVLAKKNVAFGGSPPPVN